MAKLKIVDPSPSGWVYGFPKVYDNPENLPMADWLVSKGYPKELAEICVTRWWDSEEA